MAYNLCRGTRGSYYKEYRQTKKSKGSATSKKRKFSPDTYWDDVIHQDQPQTYEDEEIREGNDEEQLEEEEEEARGEEEEEEARGEEEEGLEAEEALDEEDRERYKEVKNSLSSKPFVWEDLSPYSSFDICQFIRYRTDIDNLPSTSDMTVLVEGSMMKLGDFKLQYQRIISSNNLTAKCADEILQLFRTALPKGNNLPAKIGCTFNDIEFGSNQSRCISVIEIESCDCGSTMYIGNYRDSTECPTCKNGRYTSGENRYPVALFNYRSVIMIIFELLQTTEFYNTICNSIYEDFRDNAHVDVMDGEIAKKHLAEMETKFLNYVSLGEDALILPLNLLLCLQYDGAQVFHHSVTNFWPLLLTILNLPPNLRKEVGVGTFMVALFTAYSNSLCENFLFKKLLIEELRLLYEGYVLNVRGKRFYLQARLILHCYDSKALESVVKVQGTNSLAGCGLCRLAPGWGLKKKMLSAATYAGHRRLLPRNHFLRAFGQSGKCCPKFYYSDVGVLERSFLSSEQQPAKFNNRIHNISNKCDAEEIVFDDYHFTAYDNALYDLKQFLFYHHCDYRSFIPYGRVSNDTYITDGKLAAVDQQPINRRNRHEYYHSTLAVKKRGKVVNVNGVKDVWAFEKLPYADVSENVCYDPFHVFKNIISYVFNYLTGERKINDKAKEFCRNTLCHPRVYSSSSSGDKSKVKEIWELTEAETKEIEEKFLKKVILPLGFKSHFRIRILFSQMGNIRGKEMINIFECAMDLLCYAISLTCSDYPTEYLLYFSMLSRLISDLSAPVFLDDEIENLYQRVVELVCVHEGLFPVSETKMVFHQLIDLPHFIKKFGPIRGWWTLPSERGIAIIKQKLTKGNYKKYYKRVYTNEFTDEFLEANVRYSSKSSLYQNTIDDSSSFTDFKTQLLYKKENKCKLTLYQIREYIQFMLNELVKVSDCNNVKELHSPLLRVLKYFENNCRSGKFIHENGKLWKFNRSEFLEFLERFSNNSFDDLFHVLVEDINAEESGTVSQIAWDNVQRKNKLFRKDFQFVKRLFSTDCYISLYRSAFIRGVKFSGRGIEFLEIDEPLKHYVYGQLSEHEVLTPSNCKNDWKVENMREEALDKASSFLCMVKIREIRKGKKLGGDNLIFCQVNMFGRIDEPMEELINKTLYALVVTRDCANISLRVNSNVHKFDNLYSSKLNFVANPTMVNVNDIYPCPIAVALKHDDNDEILITLLQRNRQQLLNHKTIQHMYNT